ncbi:MAG: hypothetical protein CBC48_10000 [bacterium TMED88]|nr:hypothetical protein [Deltaproteobacteria bacterium]OUV31079.1 MAG: hypothetical protein CBC48_10000 [bacterium TMED88]
MRFQGVSELARRGGGEPLRVLAISPEDAPEKCPVIIFSHGLGGRPRRLLGWAQEWARRGFLCLLPHHRDGVGSGLERGAPGQGEFLPDLSDRTAIREALASDGSVFESRIIDMRDLMDALEDGVGVHCGWGAVECESMGLAGHSIGAYAAQVLAGARVHWGKESGLASHRDERVSAVLLISPQGAGRLGLREDSWSDFRCPMMCVSGARDRGAEGEGSDWRRQPFEAAASPFRYQVTVPGADHFAILGRHTGEGPAHSGQGPPLHAITGLFWQAHLRGDSAAKASLETGRFQAEPGGAWFNFEVGQDDDPLGSA